MRRAEQRARPWLRALASASVAPLLGACSEPAAPLAPPVEPPPSLGVDPLLWASSGGAGPAPLVAPSRGSSVWLSLANGLRGLDEPPETAQWQPGLADVVRRVRETESALGVTSMAEAERVRPLALRAGDAVVQPGAPEWPLGRQIVLVTRGEPRGFAPLLRAAKSEAGKAALAKRRFRSPLPEVPSNPAGAP